MVNELLLFNVTEPRALSLETPNVYPSAPVTAAATPSIEMLRPSLALSTSLPAESNAAVTPVSVVFALIAVTKAPVPSDAVMSTLPMSMPLM
ncbi:MAG: hypothetical protein FD129_2933 [bacterium]|nr:MAG: hypothetical protein FD129_2933 [bacterium]